MSNATSIIWRRALPFFAIIVSVVIFYGPTLTGEFLLDDHVLIRNNAFVQKRQPLLSYFSQEDGILDRKNWDGEFHTGYYRPLINLTYFIDYKLWGMNPVGFRLSNLLFHVLTCALLYLVLTQVCTNHLAALGLSLLFALHPVNTEAVSWVASRNNILATFFSLSAFYFYAATSARPRWLPRILSLASFGLSMFCKEFGVMLLPILFLHNRLTGGRKSISVREVLGYLPFLAILAGYLWARTMVIGAMASSETDFSLWWRIAFAPYLVAYNLGLVFWPVGLHNFLVVYPQSLLSRQLLYGLLASCLIGVLLWRFRERRWFIFGALSFLVGLFPVLNIIPTASATLIAMRWLYFPSVFLCIALCPLLERRGGVKTAAAVICVAAFLGVATYRLNTDHWHDESTFFASEVLRYQNYFYAGALAELYAKKGDLQGAAKYFSAGIDQFPTMIENHINYSAMLIETGSPATALAVIEKALELTMSRTNRGGLYSNQGMALARLGRMDEAVRALEKAVEFKPDAPEIMNNLGTVYGMIGDYEKAKDILEKGLSIAPESIGMKRNLAVTLLRTGDYPAAVEILESIPAALRQRDPSLLALLTEANEKAAARRHRPAVTQ